MFYRILKIKLLSIITFFYTFYSIHNQTQFNFAGKQNPEVDLYFSHITGTSLYFYEDNNNTLLIYNIYPDLRLKFSFKIYTNNTMLYQIYENKMKSIFIGIDFLFNSTDLSIIDYRGDIVICQLNINSFKCNDYLYDFKNQEYLRNNQNNTLIGRKILSKINLFKFNFKTVLYQMILISQKIFI